MSRPAPILSMPNALDCDGLFRCLFGPLREDLVDKLNTALAPDVAHCVYDSEHGRRRLPAQLVRALFGRVCHESRIAAWCAVVQTGVNHAAHNAARRCVRCARDEWRESGDALHGPGLKPPANG